MHARGDVQRTPASSLEIAPLGLPVCWMDHFVPFQRSANVADGPLLGCQSPTAVHAMRDTHETPFKNASAAPAGVGLVWVVQRFPFQRSTRVWMMLPAWVEPTATHAFAEVQAIPSKPELVEPLGLGVCTMDHFLPFQRSASVLSVLPS